MEAEIVVELPQTLRRAAIKKGEEEAPNPIPNRVSLCEKLQKQIESLFANQKEEQVKKEKSAEPREDVGTPKIQREKEEKTNKLILDLQTKLNRQEKMMGQIQQDNKDKEKLEGELKAQLSKRLHEAQHKEIILQEQKERLESEQREQQKNLHSLSEKVHSFQSIAESLKAKCLDLEVVIHSFRDVEMVVKGKLESSLRIHEEKDGLVQHYRELVNKWEMACKEREKEKEMIRGKLLHCKQAAVHLQEDKKQLHSKIEWQEKEMERKQEEIKEGILLLEKESETVAKLKEIIAASQSKAEPTSTCDTPTTVGLDNSVIAALHLREDHSVRMKLLQKNLVSERKTILRLKDEAKAKTDVLMRQISVLQKTIEDKNMREQVLENQIRQHKKQSGWTKLLPQKRKDLSVPVPMPTLAAGNRGGEEEAEDLSDPEAFADDCLDLGDILYGKKKKCSTCGKEVLVDSFGGSSDFYLCKGCRPTARKITKDTNASRNAHKRFKATR